MDLPTNEEIWREGIHVDLVEFANNQERLAHENYEYFRLFNIALYEIKQRVFIGNIAVCILLGLILWRVW